MVSTRHHPKPFPEPPSPTSRSSPTKRETPSTDDKRSLSPSPDIVSPLSSKQRTIALPPKGYVHYPTRLSIIWLCISLPLVIWDFGYVFLRPHSMPGGKYHSPIWTPYALYSTVDYVYGWPAYEEGSGFTAAQSSLNVLETFLYLYYAFVVYTEGWSKRKITLEGFLAGKQRFMVEEAASATLLFWATNVMTASKTVLFVANTAFERPAFKSIRHNDAWNLLFLWVLPNGAWILVPSVILWRLGEELVSALNGAGKKRG